MRRRWSGRGDARRAAELSPARGRLPHRLVLWDIDGTLVESAKLGRDAFFEAFEVVTGSPPREMVPFAGRTDLEIAHDMLERAGVPADDQLLHSFGEALARAMADRKDELRRRGRALPGAREALAALRRQDGVVQSLLTGNIEPNAAVKLGAFGLERDVELAIGAYGSDHRMRGELVAVARRKAQTKHGIAFAPEDVSVIGDTPLDIAAARQGGARAVGVATGPYDQEELQDSGADFVLADLTDTPAVVAAAIGEPG